VTVLGEALAACDPGHGTGFIVVAGAVDRLRKSESMNFPDHTRSQFPDPRVPAREKIRHSIP
jgi:hypothetical protein